MAQPRVLREADPSYGLRRRDEGWFTGRVWLLPVGIDYTTKTEPARAFQIRANGSGPNRDYCIAEFGPAGFLSQADTPDHDFRFDGAGRFQR